MTAVPDDQSVELNAPFSTAPVLATYRATITYSLGRTLPSVSIFDYWSPSEAIQRILCGAVVDKMKIVSQRDFHEFQFPGPAQDLIDNVSLHRGQGQLDEFPSRARRRIASIIRLCQGHMGQVWLGLLRSVFTR